MKITILKILINESETTRVVALDISKGLSIGAFDLTFWYSSQTQVLWNFRWLCIVLDGKSSHEDPVNNAGVSYDL